MTGPTAKPGSAPWTEDHSSALLRAIITTVLANRSQLYACPDLADVNGNGGDRINKQTQSMLRKWSKEYAAGRDIVGEIVASTPKKRKGDKAREDGTGPVTPTKKKRTPKSSPKVEDEVGNELDFESEEGSA